MRKSQFTKELFHRHFDENVTSIFKNKLFALQGNRKPQVIITESSEWEFKSRQITQWGFEIKISKGAIDTIFYETEVFVDEIYPNLHEDIHQDKNGLLRSLCGLTSIFMLSHEFSHCFRNHFKFLEDFEGELGTTKARKLVEMDADIFSWQYTLGTTWNSFNTYKLLPWSIYVLILVFSMRNAARIIDLRTGDSNKYSGTDSKYPNGIERSFIALTHGLTGPTLDILSPSDKKILEAQAIPRFIQIEALLTTGNKLDPDALQKLADHELAEYWKIKPIIDKQQIMRVQKISVFTKLTMAMHVFFKKVHFKYLNCRDRRLS